MHFSRLFTMSYVSVVSMTMVVFYMSCREDSVIDTKTVLVSMLGGFVRGFLIGFIASDLAGGLITGSTIAAVNPIIMMLERSLLDTRRSLVQVSEIHDEAE